MSEQLAGTEESDDDHGPGRRGRGLVRYLQNETAPSVPRMRLGDALRHRREALDLQQGEVARRLNWSPSKVSRLEGGHHRCKEQDVLRLLDEYQIQEPQERQELELLADLANTPTWWHKYSSVTQRYLQTAISFEYMAKRIKAYDTIYLHGLLQAPEYARALIEQSPNTDRHNALVKLRTERQHHFNAMPGKTMICVINEAVLRNGVGNTAIMRRQLQHLIDLSSNPRYHLRLLEQGLFNKPFHLGTTVIFEFRDRNPKIVYKEDFQGALTIQDQAMMDEIEPAFDELRGAALTPAATQRKLIDLLRSNLYR